MTHRPTLMFGVVMLFCSWPMTLPLLGQAPAAVDTPVKTKAHVSWGDIPLSFEPNLGQEPAEVRYLARGNTYTLYLTDAEMLLNGRNEAPLRMTFVGANPAPRIVGEGEQLSITNYLIGNDPGKWRTSVPNYGKARYRSVYPGIDLLYYGHDGNLEYDWILSPSADPRRIRLRFDGADHVQVDKQGELVITVGETEYRQRKPVVYQDIGGKRIEIAGRWQLHGKEAGFRIGGYDRNQPLVIDPALYYSTYLGGSNNDYANAVAVDNIGNTYVTGGTASANFPAANPLQASLRGSNDVFVTKFNATGSARIYSTFLGSGGVDEGRGIAVNSLGEVYVTGSAGFSDFPTKNAIQSTWGGSGDAFLTKLDSTGSSLVYSTYLGGNAIDFGNAVALDPAGNAYVTGVTFSPNFPTVNAFQSTKGLQQDAFVAKISPSGSAWVYVTYLGGNSVDEGYGIAVDASGNAYLTGQTQSTNFPLSSPLQFTNHGGIDGFVAKLNPAGSALVYSTYLGGTGNDYGTAIAVDASGSAYVTGVTASDDFPLASPIDNLLGSHAVDDVFVTKFTPAGSALVYSTYLGGGSEDDAYAIAIDKAGNAYVTGRTNSSDFPLVNPIQVTRFAFDMFVTEINAPGSALLFSTFVGGSGSESGRGIAIDSLGNIHIAGESTSTDFPVKKAVQTGSGGNQDAIVLLFADTAPPTVTVALDRQSLTFAATSNGAAFVSQTGPQVVTMPQSMGPAVSWTAVSDKPWLVVSPTSGTGSAKLIVSVQFVPGLSATQAGTITIANAANSVGPISVTLNTIPSGTSQPPFGSFDTPFNNATGIAGSLPVTGWALDDVGVTRVTICRVAVSGETLGPDARCNNQPQAYIGDGVFIDGARPDVQGTFPTAPMNTRAGWGYMMLSNFLPNLGNGTFTLTAYAFDLDGHVAAIGSKTITCDNAHSVNPFGSIDTPGQGEVISGSYGSFGWVLSPGAAKADAADGGTVQVFVDGTNIGTPGGWTSRSDLTALFPIAQYSGVNKALAIIGIDSTAFANGIHTYAWNVTDTASHSQGVGSRFIGISNGSLTLDSDAPQPSNVIAASNVLEVPHGAAPRIGASRSELFSEAARAASDLSTIQGRRGFDLERALQAYPVINGRIDVQAEELDRVELHLSPTSGHQYTGYLRTTAGLTPLPIGSHLDTSTGEFTWMPGVGFYGAYDFVFVRWDGGVAAARQDVRITLNARGSNRVGPQTIIDVPSASASVGRAFYIGGWAADLDSPVDSGVNAVHVWAYPIDASGTARDPIFLGPAIYGGARPDVATVYGDRFGDSGYGIIVNGLAPGTYDIAVFAYSTIVHNFTPASVVRVTVR